MKIRLVATVINLKDRTAAIPPPVVTPKPQSTNPPAQTFKQSAPKWLSNPNMDPSKQIGTIGVSSVSKDKAVEDGKNRLSKEVVQQFKKKDLKFDEKVIGAWVVKYCKVGGNYEDRGWNRAWVTLGTKAYNNLAKWIQDNPLTEEAKPATQ